MSNLTSFPYNLTVLGEAEAPVDYLFAVNQASGAVMMPFILAMIFFVAYYILERQNFDVPSCLSYSAYITFVVSLMGRLIVIGGEPLVQTYVVIFLLIIISASTVYSVFSGSR